MLSKGNKDRRKDADCLLSHAIRLFSLTFVVRSDDDFSSALRAEPLPTAAVMFETRLVVSASIAGSLAISYATAMGTTMRKMREKILTHPVCATAS